MDCETIDRGATDRERLEAIADSLGGGVVLVGTGGDVVWMDRGMRRRVNGELGRLDLPLPRAPHRSVDCFATPVEFTVNGERMRVCVLQEAAVDHDREGQDLLTAIEAIMADSASWFTRTVLDKLKAIRRPDALSALADHGRDLDLLSDREREVLGLICEGKSSTAIGETLGLSENTVRNHIAAVYRKIGVNRRSEAIIWARERGITGRDSIVMGRAGRNRERARRLLSN